MSLLCLLLHPVAIIYLGMATMAAAVETPPPATPAPQQPAAPAAPPADWKYTKEQLAVKPANILVLNCALITKLEAEILHLGDPKAKDLPAAAERAEYRKEHDWKIAAAWKEIDAVKASVSAMSLDPESEAVATPAHQMGAATKVLSELNQKMIAIIDSGKPLDSPEIRALVAKARPVSAVQDDQGKRAIKEMRRVLGELAAAQNAAGKAGSAPAPAPAPEKPGSITPGKKEPELPPGMTRTRK